MGRSLDLPLSQWMVNVETVNSQTVMYPEDLRSSFQVHLSQGCLWVVPVRKTYLARVLVYCLWLSPQGCCYDFFSRQIGRNGQNSFGSSWRHFPPKKFGNSDEMTAKFMAIWNTFRRFTDRRHKRASLRLLYTTTSEFGAGLRFTANEAPRFVSKSRCSLDKQTQ